MSKAIATPSSDNLMLGAGQLWFDRLENGVSTGERHMGHASEVNLTTTSEKVQKYNNMVGSRRLYKSVIRQLSASLKIKLDEFDPQNLALALNGTVGVTEQKAGSATAQTFTAKKGRYIRLGQRNVTVSAVAPNSAISAAVGAATAVGTITSTGDVTSGGTFTGTVPETIYVQVSTAPTSAGAIDGGKFRWKSGQYGDWSAEVAMGATVALSNGAAVTFAATVAETFVVGDTWTIACAAAKTSYALTTDYTVDEESGRVFITETGAISDGETIKVTFAWNPETLPTVRAATSGNIEGLLRFKGDPGSGPRYEMEAWRVAITPDGEIGLISEEFAQFGLTADCQDDSTNHPVDPYLRLLYL